MFKKLTMLAMAVGVLVAFAVPAAAQASELTSEETLLEKGASVTATSSNLVTTLEGGGQLECTSVVLDLEVVANGSGSVTLKQLGTATTTGCVINVGTKFAAEITDGTLGVGAGGEITVGASGETSTNASFGSDVAALGLKCTQAGSVKVVADAVNDVLSVGPSALTATGTGCKNGTIEGGFALTSGGSAVEID